MQHAHRHCAHAHQRIYYTHVRTTQFGKSVYTHASIGQLNNIFCISKVDSPTNRYMPVKYANIKTGRILNYAGV